MMRTVNRAAAALMFLGAWLAPACGAQAVAKPALQFSLTPVPTNFAPGSTGTDVYGPMFRLVLTNVGGAPTSGTVTMKVSLPPDLVPVPGAASGDTSPVQGPPISPECDILGQEVVCTVSEPTYPGRWIGALIPVEVSGSLEAGDQLEATASAEGGGAEPVSTSYEVEIETEAPPFDFLPGSAGLSTLFTGTDGTAATMAGSHPGQATISIGLPTAQLAPESAPLAAGHLRTVTTELPHGFVGNPNATPVRCTEAELITGEPGDPGCPVASQVGLITAMTVEGNVPFSIPTGLYNMVPPPGVPAEFAFNALNFDIFVHIDAKLRSDGDLGVSVGSDDIIARTGNPIMSVQAQVWGDPSAQSHDEIRSINCSTAHHHLCPVERRNAAFLTMPSACSGPLSTRAKVSSWEKPAITRERSAQSSDIFGNPTGINGCSTLEFEPSLTLEPDTHAAETPTGARIQLHLPQNNELVNEEGEPQRATANLKDTTITLPEGMALNPAAADGLQACGSTQIGLKSAVGQAPIHFSSDRPNCPMASKVGTVTVKTPLLDHPVPGAVYVAAPYDNPFGSLLAVYVVIDDPADGVVIKLAGKTEADPITGQLTTSFSDAPELPFEDFEVDLKGGPRAVLRTPSTCGTYATKAAHAPWSGSETVHNSDSFAIGIGANGGACPRDEASMPNSPDFSAGTETPIAGSYSPFLGRLSRADGTQLMKALNLNLPPGLSGKLAGTSICSDAALSAAASRKGREEQAGPSCPGSSLLGEVEVGAGAGPSPYYTGGKVYLAGPYEGAPLSFAVVTPAVAGPFDLGTVVVRVAARVDRDTAVISADSDPFPRILEGIPLEVRDIHVDMNRPGFIINPTSCAAMQVSGQAISLLGGAASLSSRFQVGGCRALDFEPHLSLRLSGGTGRGAHPRLRAVGTTKPGEANLARASVALPHSEFLDQAHIRTVCTRVQFNAEQCPAGAIYGHIRAESPLLDEALEGPVYLRSSSHKLPDMVAVLKGPPSRPIEIDVIGRIDSVNGGIRTTIDSVPDAPVSKFVLSLQGGKKGLLINSRNTCKTTNRATVKLNGQNGKIHDFRPALKADCGKRK